jgi:hypothetical protein
MSILRRVRSSAEPIRLGILSRRNIEALTWNTDVTSLPYVALRYHSSLVKIMFSLAILVREPRPSGNYFFKCPERLLCIQFRSRFYVFDLLIHVRSRLPVRAIRNGDPSSQSKAKVHISHHPVTLQNWYKHINSFSTTLVILIPIYSLYTVRYTPLQRAIAIWSLLYYFLTGFGITGGYHRLWSHRCYSACTPLRYFLALVGAGAV